MNDMSLGDRVREGDWGALRQLEREHARVEVLERTLRECWTWIENYPLSNRPDEHQEWSRLSRLCCELLSPELAKKLLSRSPRYTCPYCGSNDYGSHASDCLQTDEPIAYRRVVEMNADELLSLLTPEPQHQINLFVQLGGNPNDHNYARLSFLTRELRERGVPVKTSRKEGVWLEKEEEHEPANA